MPRLRDLPSGSTEGLTAYTPQHDFKDEPDTWHWLGLLRSKSLGAKVMTVDTRFSLLGDFDLAR